jgi:hypothetical protein
MPAPIRPQTFDLIPLIPPKVHFWQSGYADSVSIDTVGVTVRYGGSKAVWFRWSDPELEYYLADLRRPLARGARWDMVDQAKRTPFMFNPGPWAMGGHAPTLAWVPQPVFDALHAAGIAVRLHMYVNEGLPHWPSDVVFTTFSRKPSRFKAAHDYNPNALP